MEISTDPARLDFERVHRYLSEESYWARGIRHERLSKALANSLCFGGYLDGRMVAFGRVVTDYATAGDLKDVFVVPEFRGRGFGKLLVEAIINHPDLQGVHVSLRTKDAHRLYERFGFMVHPHPERAMIKFGDWGGTWGPPGP